MVYEGKLLSLFTRYKYFLTPPKHMRVFKERANTLRHKLATIAVPADLFKRFADYEQLKAIDYALPRFMLALKPAGATKVALFNVTNATVFDR